MVKKIILFVFIFLFLVLVGFSSLLEQVNKLLERDDKVTLGGGKMVVFSPEFPLFQDFPGFWDHAVFLNYKVQPLFTVTFMDKDFHEMSLQKEERKWFPSHVVQKYKNKNGLIFIEMKFLHPSAKGCCPNSRN